MFISPDLKKFAKEYNFIQREGYVYGVYGGYTVTFVEGWDLKIVSVACDTAEGEKITGIFTSEFMRSHRIKNYRITPYGIKVTFNEFFPVMGKVKSFLQFFINHLRMLGVKGDGFCTVCGNDITAQSNVIISDGIVRIVHSECVEKAFSYVEDKKQPSNKEAKVFVGALSTLLATFVTGIVSFTILMFLEKTLSFLPFTLLVFLFTVFAYVPAAAGEKCYGLLGSKFNKTAAVLMSLTELAGMVAALFVTMVFIKADANMQGYMFLLLLLGWGLGTYKACARYLNTKIKAESFKIVLH